MIAIIRPPARIVRILKRLGRPARFAWFARFEVADRSMAPLLEPGDYLIAGRVVRHIARGDIVVFRAGDRYLIKRVIGLPGERVRIESGVLTIDGMVFTEPWWSAATRPDGQWPVPADSWFVLGDNRPHSAQDSRYSGPIDREALHSIVIARYRPIRRARLFP